MFTDIDTRPALEHCIFEPDDDDEEYEILPNTIQLIESELPLDQAKNHDIIFGNFLFCQLHSLERETLECLFCRGGTSLINVADLRRHYQDVHELAVSSTKADIDENIFAQIAEKRGDKSQEIIENIVLTPCCVYCDNVRLRNVTEAEEHYESVHGKVLVMTGIYDVSVTMNCFYCSVCSEPSVDFYNHIRHMKMSHKKKTFVCRYCTYSSPSSSLLRIHVLQRHMAYAPEERLECPICKLKVQGNINYTKHLLMNHVVQSGRNFWTCSECLRTYFDPYDLLKHLPQCPKVKPNNSGEINYQISNVFNCHLCPIKSVTVEEVQNHVYEEDHTPERIAKYYLNEDDTKTCDPELIDHKTCFLCLTRFPSVEMCSDHMEYLHKKWVLKESTGSSETENSSDGQTESGDEIVYYIQEEIGSSSGNESNDGLQSKIEDIIENHQISLNILWEEQCIERNVERIVRSRAIVETDQNEHQDLPVVQQQESNRNEAQFDNNYCQMYGVINEKNTNQRLVLKNERKNMPPHIVNPIDLNECRIEETHFQGFTEAPENANLINNVEFSQRALNNTNECNYSIVNGQKTNNHILPVTSKNEINEDSIYNQIVGNILTDHNVNTNRLGTVNIPIKERPQYGIEEDKENNYLQEAGHLVNNPDWNILQRNEIFAEEFNQTNSIISNESAEIINTTEETIQNRQEVFNESSDINTNRSYANVYPYKNMLDEGSPKEKERGNAGSYSEKEWEVLEQNLERARKYAEKILTETEEQLNNEVPQPIIDDRIAGMKSKEELEDIKNFRTVDEHEIQIEDGIIENELFDFGYPEKLGHYCFLCDKMIKKFSLYYAHMRYFHQLLSRFQCVICKKTFKSSLDFREHAFNVHNQNSPYSCKLCDMTFEDLENKERHNKSNFHINRLKNMVLTYDRSYPRNYKCRNCNFFFGLFSSFVHHMEMDRNCYIHFTQGKFWIDQPD